jgi:hypothetical protein
MKKVIQQSLQLLITDRYLLVLCGSLLLLAALFATFVGFSVHPSEIQLVSHYSAFGVTHLYRDQWYYLLTFGAFGLFAAMIHVILAIKLFMVKGHSIAIMFTWLGIAVVLLAWVTTSAVINVWTPLLQ